MTAYKKSILFENVLRHKDKRGDIISIVDDNIQNVSIITCLPNTIRSNHYHLKDQHYMYVLSGSIDYFFKDLNSEKIEYFRVNPGSTIFTPPLEIHATYFEKETKLIVSSKFPRDHETYENDTVRIPLITFENLKLIKNRFK